MYLDFLVKVPTVKGKITRRKKSNVVYIEYEYDRVYDPSRKNLSVGVRPHEIPIKKIKQN